VNDPFGSLLLDNSYRDVQWIWFVDIKNAGSTLLAEKYGNPTQKAKKGEDHGYDQWISMEPPAALRLVKWNI